VNIDWAKGPDETIHFELKTTAAGFEAWQVSQLEYYRRLADALGVPRDMLAGPLEVPRPPG
jgi:hypothetical protein